MIEWFLRADLSASRDASSPHRFELYVFAPITGLRAGDLRRHHEDVAQVVDALRSFVDVYWPGESITSTEELRAADIATEENIQVLMGCEALLYLQFAEVVRPSGALVELGLALGRRLRTTAIIGPNLPLPFMLHNFDAVAARVGQLPNARTYIETPASAARSVKINQRRLLGL